MKVIIAGGRTVTDYKIAEQAIYESGFDITEVVSGGARGADRCGELFAQHGGLGLKVFPANWDKFGRGAGHIRNEEMAKYADALIAIWDGESKGTKNMIERATKLGLQVFVFRLK